MIDLHCHLDLFPEPFVVSEHCRRQKIYVLAVTTTPSAWPQSRKLSQPGDRIRVALGLHPQLAHERKHELDLFEELLPHTRYVGEIGLDGGLELAPHQADQKYVFDRILSACAKPGGKIMSIHSRRAARPVIDAIAAHNDAGTFVLHWFSGSNDELKHAINRGCWFSVGPSMLQSKKGQALASAMPRDRILTETDGPFATNGVTPLMPWNAAEAEVMLAHIWKLPVADTQLLLQSNLRTLVTGNRPS